MQKIKITIMLLLALVAVPLVYAQETSNIDAAGEMVDPLPTIPEVMEFNELDNEEIINEEEMDEGYAEDDMEYYGAEETGNEVINEEEMPDLESLDNEELLEAESIVNAETE